MLLTRPIRESPTDSSRSQYFKINLKTLLFSSFSLPLLHLQILREFLLSETYSIRDLDKQKEKHHFPALLNGLRILWAYEAEEDDVVLGCKGRIC